MKLYVLFYTFLFVGVINAEETDEEEYVLPTDPELEADKEGEPLTTEELENAGRQPEEETVEEYGEGHPDPIENHGLEDFLTEGDIYLPPDDDAPGSRHVDKKWDYGVIPYKISATFNKKERARMAAAMQQFQKNTCISFKPRTNQKHYIHIVRLGGCYSMIGRVGGAQRVSLGKGCMGQGIIAHEFLHAVGFFHEQSRLDRDKHVWIYFQNIRKGFENNFKIAHTFSKDIMKLPYELGSVMHYPKWAFKKKGSGDTIAAKNGRKTLGNWVGLTQLDIKKINTLYKCKGTNPKPKPSGKSDCFKAIAYRGGPIKQITGVQSPTDCQKQCKKISNCAYWTLDWNKKCWLNDKSARKDQGKFGEVGGPRNCSSKSKDSSIIRDVAFGGGDLNLDLPLSTESTSVCKQHCSSVTGADLWLLQNNNNCWCKKLENTEIRHQPGNQAGILPQPSSVINGVDFSLGDLNINQPLQTDSTWSCMRHCFSIDGADLWLLQNNGYCWCKKIANTIITKQTGNRGGILAA